MPPLKRAGLTLLGTLLVYALLVATHLGEFWPFSIYPMFSQGGQPWSRAVVREVSDADASMRDASMRWATLSASELPGRPLPLKEHGVDNIDLANFVSKTTTWDSTRVEALRTLFEGTLTDRSLVVMRVNGRFTDDSVAVEFVPYVYLEADSTALNPSLRPGSPRSGSPLAQRSF